VADAELLRLSGHARSERASAHHGDDECLGARVVCLWNLPDLEAA